MPDSIDRSQTQVKSAHSSRFPGEEAGHRQVVPRSGSDGKDHLEAAPVEAIARALGMQEALGAYQLAAAARSNISKTAGDALQHIAPRDLEFSPLADPANSPFALAFKGRKLEAILKPLDPNEVPPELSNKNLHKLTFKTGDKTGKGTYIAQSYGGQLYIPPELTATVEDRFDEASGVRVIELTDTNAQGKKFLASPYGIIKTARFTYDVATGNLSVYTLGQFAGATGERTTHVPPEEAKVLIGLFDDLKKNGKIKSDGT